MFTPFVRRESQSASGTTPEPEKPAAKSGGEIDDLKRELDEMRRKVDKLTGGND
jgi:hypothetical protein